MLKRAWLACLGSVVTAGLTLGQPTPEGILPPAAGPFASGNTKPTGPSIHGNPDPLGYPGYPRYGPPMPVGPAKPAPLPPSSAFPFSYPPGFGPSAPQPFPVLAAPGFVTPPSPVPTGPGGTTPPMLPDYSRPDSPVPPGWQGYGTPNKPNMPWTGHGPPPGYGTPLRTPEQLPGGDQPYLVPREAPALPMAPNHTPPPLPAPAPRPVNPAAPPPEFEYEPAPFIEIGPPTEPYTLYEGRRYMSEVKLDHSRVWVQAAFIHWWVCADNPPPLVTTGNPASANAGAINNSDTRVLLGDGSIGPTQFSGIQASAGMWLDEDRLSSLEIAGFWLGKSSRQYQFAASAATPVLAQPIQTPTEAVINNSFPGVVSGNITVNSIMDFHSGEVNYLRNLYRINGWAIDGFTGVRYLYLNDNLSLNQNVTVLGRATIPFNGVGRGAGSAFQFYDSFNVTNRFYGGQIGLRVNWAYGRWDLGAIGKLGMGGTAHTVYLDGLTTFTPASGGASTTAVGSTLAQASNIGKHGGTDFSLVPELNATLGYQATGNLRFLVGYNLLSWTQVERAGHQIDRSIDLTQSPTNAAFVPGAVGTNPLFRNARSEFWAHGVNVGMELKY